MGVVAAVILGVVDVAAVTVAASIAGQSVAKSRKSLIDNMIRNMLQQFLFCLEDMHTCISIAPKGTLVVFNFNINRQQQQL